MGTPWGKYDSNVLSSFSWSGGDNSGILNFSVVEDFPIKTSETGVKLSGHKERDEKE